jgi:virginiamycin B lyase
MRSPAPAAERLAVRKSRMRARLVVVALLLLGAVATALWRVEPWSGHVIEYPMLGKTDIPTAVAVAPDGAIWFTIELSSAIGVLRNGRIERLPKQTPNLEPLGLAVDVQGAAWYTDGPARAISRIAPNGTIRSFPLSTPIARLGRLAIAADGAVWFADATALSITRLRDGVFTRHDVGAFRASPFAVAVDANGAVWATLLEANKLLRVSPDGRLTSFDVPTPVSGLGDVAVDASGAVWFIEGRANRIGYFSAGRFSEFPVPTPSAGLTALAVAPDGSVWFSELRGQKLGRLSAGRIVEFRLPRADVRPFGVAVDAANNVWYTDLGGRLGMLAAARAKAR